MAKILYLNNFECPFIDAVKDVPTTGTPATELNYGILRLNNMASGVLVNPTGGDYYLLTAFKRSGGAESAFEVMKVTEVDITTYPGECRIKVDRAQEGTSAKAYVTGDFVQLRWTKGSAEAVVQRDAAETLTNKTLVSPAIGTPASGNLGNCVIPNVNGGQLAGFRQKLINASFAVNQRAVSGTVTLAAGAYGHDRWKAGASGCTYTFSTTNNVTTITISAGSLQQVVEGVNLDTGTHCLSWSGSATGKIGVGSYAASGVTGSVTGGTNTTIEFSTGTLSRPQFEPGSIATPSESRSYSVELAMSMHYYEQSDSLTAYWSTKTVVAGTVGLTSGFGFSAKKRTIPTVTIYSRSGTSGKLSTTSGTDIGATVTASGINSLGVRCLTDSSSGLTAGSLYEANYTASAEL